MSVCGSWAIPRRAADHRFVSGRGRSAVLAPRLSRSPRRRRAPSRSAPAAASRRPHSTACVCPCAVLAHRRGGRPPAAPPRAPASWRFSAPPRFSHQRSPSRRRSSSSSHSRTRGSSRSCARSSAQHVQPAADRRAAAHSGLPSRFRSVAGGHSNCCSSLNRRGHWPVSAPWWGCWRGRPGVVFEWRASLGQ